MVNTRFSLDPSDLKSRRENASRKNKTLPDNIAKMFPEANKRKRRSLSRDEAQKRLPSKKRRKIKRKEIIEENEENDVLNTGFIHYGDVVDLFKKTVTRKKYQPRNYIARKMPEADKRKSRRKSKKEKKKSVPPKKKKKTKSKNKKEINKNKKRKRIRKINHILKTYQTFFLEIEN